MADTELVYSTIKCVHCKKDFCVKMRGGLPKPETKFVMHIGCGNEMPIESVMQQIEAAKQNG